MISLDPTQSFDFLLERYSKELPLELQLAVRHESAGTKLSTLAKKQDKHLQRSLRANRPLRAYIKSMYEKSVNAFVAKERDELGEGDGAKTWKWQAEKGPPWPREKGPPSFCQFVSP